MTALQQHTALTNARGDVLEALRTAPQAGRAINALNTIIAPDEAETPLLTYLEKWQATLPKSKHAEAWVANLREFDAMVGQSLERLSGKHVVKWIEACWAIPEASAHHQVQARRADQILGVDGEPRDRQSRPQSVPAQDRQVQADQGRARRCEQGGLPAGFGARALARGRAVWRSRTELRDFSLAHIWVGDWKRSVGSKSPTFVGLAASHIYMAA